MCESHPGGDRWTLRHWGALSWCKVAAKLESDNGEQPSHHTKQTNNDRQDTEQHQVVCVTDRTTLPYTVTQQPKMQTHLGHAEPSTHLRCAENFLKEVDGQMKEQQRHQHCKTRNQTILTPRGQQHRYSVGAVPVLQDPFFVFLWPTITDGGRFQTTLSLHLSANAPGGEF